MTNTEAKRPTPDTSPEAVERLRRVVQSALVYEDYGEIERVPLEQADTMIEALSDERDALKAELAEAVGVLKDMRDDKIGHRHAVHFRRRAAVFLARLEGER